jgi:hypothetical protein
VSFANLHEIVAHRVKGEGVNVVLDFLAEGLSQTRIRLAMLADGLRAMLSGPWY